MTLNAEERKREEELLKDFKENEFLTYEKAHELRTLIIKDDTINESLKSLVTFSLGIIEEMAMKPNFWISLKQKLRFYAGKALYS
ncbi:MAG: hypothetical protein OIN88_13965 [Candidatus Methanoperedens sp.]|nr:hypothetical protein [Candidatus Methanoperedens sp.]MCZ7361299.1 hypothetical protein [Candidatus Methanoperedens sp.]